jgi:hypothetical protein
VISRIVAGILAGGLVVSAAAIESDTARLSAKSTAAQVVHSYGAQGKASCREKQQGYWTYVCRIHDPTRSFTVDVRVDENSIVDSSRR